ncbi:MAG: acyl carrier protein [Lentisphaerae bacterium]|nr:acyl carrier protein [Lentisphaerota bacterium]
MEGNDKEQELQQIKNRLKELLIANLSLQDITPNDIKDEDPLFGEGLGLDSLDAVEIVVILQRNYGIEVKDMEMGREIFASINSLANYVHEHTTPDRV